MLNNNKVKSFATRLRAASLAEYLLKNGIPCSVSQAKWTNKRLPPPRVEVFVSDDNLTRALQLAEETGTW